MGTLLYMAPETIQGHAADARSDIFGFGCVLYEMVSGKRPFSGESMLNIAAAILEKEPQPISSLQPRTPAALEHVVHRCLMKDPEERWQSARDLSRELKWISEEVRLTQASEPAPRLRQKVWERVAWGVAALCIAMLAWLGSRPLAHQAAGGDAASSPFITSTGVYFVRSLQFRHLA